MHRLVLDIAERTDPPNQPREHSVVLQIGIEDIDSAFAV
jgi:hypothetical protein